MTDFRVYVLGAVLTLSVLSSSCSLFKKKKVVNVPAPPAPIPVQTVPQPTQPKPPVTLPPPPDLAPQQPTATDAPVPHGKLPPPPRRRPARAKPQPQPEQVAVQPPAPENSAQQPVPQLEQMLSPAQQQAYNEEIDRHIAGAQRTVAALHGRRLNGEQQTYLDRIRSFIAQATEARKNDLFRAKNLAERASLLADDLLRSVQ